MISEFIRTEICGRLAAVETEHDVRILMAIESGSRAWGFASPDSDYDVRFIYAHPKDWYLRIDLEERSDVIEYPIVDEVDLNGWDIRKALRLFWKSNPAFIEWLKSPIRYVDNSPFAANALELLPHVYYPTNGLYHYRSMALTNYRKSLTGDLVSLKKYFYVLRPLLAIRWIEATGTAPPIAFRELLPFLKGEDELLADIEDLLVQKSSTPEIGAAPRIPTIHRFIEAEFHRLEAGFGAVHRPSKPIDQLNALFRETLT